MSHSSRFLTTSSGNRSPWAPGVPAAACPSARGRHTTRQAPLTGSHQAQPGRIPGRNDRGVCCALAFPLSGRVCSGGIKPQPPLGPVRIPQARTPQRAHPPADPYGQLRATNADSWPSTASPAAGPYGSAHNGTRPLRGFRVPRTQMSAATTRTAEGLPVIGADFGAGVRTHPDPGERVVSRDG